MTDDGHEAPKRAGAGMRRALWWGLCALGTVLVLPLLLIGIVVWAVDPGGIAKREIERHRPGWEEQLGRAIAVGEVRVKLVPHIAIEVRNIAIAAQAGREAEDAEPLAQVRVVRVGVALWPMIASLGKQLDANRIEIESPRLNVVRFASGRLSYQDILDRQSSTEKLPATPLTHDQLDWIARARLGRVALKNGEFHFRDLEPAGEGAPNSNTSITKLDVVAQNVRIAEPFTVTLDAAVLADERNLHLSATVALPADLQFDSPQTVLRRAELKLSPVEIEPLLKFLPRRKGVELSRALVDANLALEMPAQAAKLRIVGEVGAGGVLLSESHAGIADRGQPMDARLKSDLLIDFMAGDVEAKLLDLTLDKMGVTASADLRNLWTTPTVRALYVASHDLTFEGLMALFPSSSLPAQTMLRGLILLNASASGPPEKARLQAALNVDGATIQLPQFHKPAGMALSFDFSGDVQPFPSSVAIEKLGVVVGPLSLLLHGTVRSVANLDLDLDSGNVDIDPLLRLLPSVERAAPAATKLIGVMRISGRVRSHGDQLAAQSNLVLRDADVHGPALSLVGGADLLLTASNQNSDPVADAMLDLTSARIMVPGEIDKAAGATMRLFARVSRAGLSWAEIATRLGEELRGQVLANAAWQRKIAPTPPAPSPTFPTQPSASARDRQAFAPPPPTR